MDWSFFAIVTVGLAGFWILKRAAFVSAERARQFLAAGAQVIDVRSPEEFRDGHVAGAINVPLGRLGAEISRVAPDKQKPLLVHCLSGGRSAIARQQLKRLGYGNVFNLGSLARARQIITSAKQH